MTDDATQAVLHELDEALAAVEQARELNPRAALAAAVNGFALLTRSNPRWACHSGPLGDLAMALLDLERGHVAPILRPKKSGAGRPVSADEDAMRVRAAYLVEAQMRYAGKTLPEAAKAVADGLTSAGGRAIESDTVIDWRKNANNSKHRFNEQFRDLIARDSSAMWADPKVRLKQMMDWLIAAQQRRNLELAQKGE